MQSLESNADAELIEQKVTDFLDRLASELLDTVEDDTSKEKLMKRLVEDQDSLQRAMADEKERQAAELQDRIKTRRQARLQRKLQREMTNRMETKERLLQSVARIQRRGSATETNVLTLD